MGSGTAGADVRSPLDTLNSHSNTHNLLLQVFVWIGKDANEVERTESVRSGERLGLTLLRKWIRICSVAVSGLSE